MKKNLLYGFFALSMAIMGISSCAPMDSDDHSLGGSVVSQDALSLTVSEGAVLLTLHKTWMIFVILSVLMVRN